MNYAWPRLKHQKKYFAKHCSINKPRKEIKKRGFVREPRPSRNEKKKKSDNGKERKEKQRIVQIMMVVERRKLKL